MLWATEQTDEPVLAQTRDYTSHQTFGISRGVRRTDCASSPTADYWLKYGASNDRADEIDRCESAFGLAYAASRSKSRRCKGYHHMVWLHDSLLSRSRHA